MTEKSKKPGSAPALMIFGVIIIVAVGLFLQQTVFNKPALTGKKRAPDVSFALEDGTQQTLASYQGQIVLLNFWASWCPPCIQEMPDLERLSRKMARHQDFVVLGASQDDTWEDLQAAATRFGVTFPVVHDLEGKGAFAFGTSKLPETYLIDRKGRIVQKWIGYQAWSSPEFIKRFEDVVNAGKGTETARLD